MKKILKTKKKGAFVAVIALALILALALFGCSLDKEVKAEILEDYLKWSGLNGEKTFNEISYKYFGTYGDSVAIYFRTAGAYETPVEEEIAGCKFNYPDSRVILIWNDGNFYKMQEALDNGLISESDVEDIHSQTALLIFGKPLFIYEEKVYCDYSEYDHLLYPEWFSANSFYVCIDANLSREGKVFDEKFFEGIDILSIEDLTDYLSQYYRDPEYRQYFYITLTEPEAPISDSDPSKEKIKQVIALLEAKEGIRRCIPEGLPYAHISSNDTYIAE